MAVLSTFREPSLCRHVHHELLRSVLLDLTPIIAPTACHQRNYVERYSRSNDSADGVLSQLHNWESQPFRQGPHVVREACGHRWRALLPPTRCLANAEGPHRLTKVVRGHREVGDRVMSLPIFRATRRLADLAPVSITISAVM